MEHIRQAVERAKADDRTPAEHLLPLEQEAAPLQPQPLLPPAGNGRTAVRPSPTGGNGHADLR